MNPKQICYLYSIQHHLADYGNMDERELTQLFADDEISEEEFTEYNLTPWCVYDSFADSQVIDYIHELAESLGDFISTHFTSQHSEP